jgi:hypothetical protein
MRTLFLGTVAGAVLASSVAAAPTTPSFFSPPRELVYYGHVRAVNRVGGRFELRIDPALWLSGETANRAAVADKVIPPGDVVPNDHYVREEGHRPLIFLASPTARVTVLTYAGKILSTRIGLAELTEIVKSRNPKKRRLFEPKNGFWIRVVGDRAVSLDQQYSP